MSATDSSPDEYFHSIEETFIRLRGAPLLLSPADWQTARAWHDAGIPVELVERSLELVFDRLRERDPDRKIQGLRYCAPAVEEAWREVLDLGATAGRLEPVAMDVAAGIETLVASLPAGLEGRGQLVARLRDLEGAAESVEGELQTIATRFLLEAMENLPPKERAALDARVSRALDRARTRISVEDLPALEVQLSSELLRQQLQLPVLSLFVRPPKAPSNPADDA